MSVQVADANVLSPAQQVLAKTLPAPARKDLIIRRQLFKYNEYYVVKDPLALTYFRLQPEEAYLLSLLDGRRELGELAALFRQRFPNAESSLETIGNFVNQLGATGLLNVRADRFVEHARRNISTSQNIIAIWAKIISGFLFFKIPLVDPSPWLGKLVHAIRFVWSPWFVGACLMFYAWTIGLLVVHRDIFSGHILNFLSPDNLIHVWATIIVIKTFHEFGHATTCRYFGGEVHEMGVCLMCFTPCGYVDASDAWMMPLKRHKLYVTIAGIFTELVIAGIAAHLWVFLPDGLARNLAFNAMIVASVNTLVFNANPLMRFDGYYVMCDWLEIPNLRTKAIQYCSYHVQRLLVGYRNKYQELMVGEESNGRMFVIYAVFAYFYMFFVIYGLTKIFARILAPYGLYDFGLYLGIFIEGSYALLPVIKVLMDAFGSSAHIVKTTSTHRRIGVTLSVCAAIFIFLSYFPSHYRVSQQAVAVAAEGEFISPTVPGVVKQVNVRTGQWVVPGDLIAVLENPDLEGELELRRIDLAEARLQRAQVQLSGNAQLMERGAETAKLVDIAQTAFDRAREDLARLELRATVAGYVVSPAVERLVGMHVVPQHSLLRIADTNRIKLKIPLTEGQAQLVERGSLLKARWVATSNRFESVLAVAPSRSADVHDLMLGMFSIFGGPSPLEPHAVEKGSGGIQTGYSLYVAEALVPKDAAGFVLEGMRAQVEIIGKAATPAQKMWRWLVTLWAE